MNRQRISFNLTITVIVLFVLAFPTMEGRAETSTLSANPVSALPLSSDPTRIKFATGATSAVVSGNLAANSSIQYILGALAFQVMDVNMTATQGASLAVTTTTGRALTPITASTASFRGYLPRTGDYLIKVSSGSQAVSYSLSVSIPERVSFERGATSATLKATVKAGQNHDYVLRAQAGQLMEINVQPENSLQLIVYGVDGTVLKSGMGEGSIYRGELPRSQDYIVTVRAGDKDVSYTVDMIIPVRISFARGAVSAAVNGWVKANGSQYYVLRAMKDQVMQVSVTSAKAVQLVVYGADGAVLKSSTNDITSFKGSLPATQDYIVVVKAGTGSSAYYTLSVIIR